MKQELTFNELITIADALMDRKRNYMEFLEDVRKTNGNSELEGIILKELEDIHNASVKINKEIWGE